MTGFKTLDKNINNTKWFFSNNVNKIDISVLPFIRQFANVDINWFDSNYFYLSAWLKKIMDSDIFNQIMKKFEVWDENERGELIIFDK